MWCVGGVWNERKCIKYSVNSAVGRNATQGKGMSLMSLIDRRECVFSGENESNGIRNGEKNEE